MVLIKGAPLTEYERQRALNIARNEAAMAALGVTSVANEVKNVIANARKRQGSEASSPRDKKPKPKPEDIVIRRSLRLSGLNPDGKKTETLSQTGEQSSSQETEEEDKVEDSKEKREVEQREGSVEFEKTGSLEDLGKFLGKLKDIRDSQKQEEGIETKEENSGSEKSKRKDAGQCSDLTEVTGNENVSEQQMIQNFQKFELDSHHVVKVMKERIYSILFLPLRHKSIVVAGDKAGHVSFLDISEGKNETADDVRVFDFSIHKNVVSEILCAPDDGTKLYTCSYDGRVCVLDVDHSSFYDIHSSTKDRYNDFRLHSPSPATIYLGDHDGNLTVLDIRDKKAVSKYQNLHCRRIHTLDFHPFNDYLLATSSTDTCVRLWDVRSLPNAGRVSRSPTPILSLRHSKGVTSAYFSPDGNCLASTCYDDCIRVWDGISTLQPDSSPRKTNLSEGDISGPKRIAHSTQSEWWLSPYRSIWMRDSCHLLIGGRPKTIDLLSRSKDSTISQLSSPLMTAIPARLAVDPNNVMIAGGTSSGRMYVWKQMSE